MSSAAQHHETIPPEAAEGMGLPLNDDERKKRMEALRQSLEPDER